MRPNIGAQGVYQDLTIIPGSPKRLPRIPSRTSIKIDYITPWVTTHGNSGISFKERSLLAILFSIAYLISTSQTPETIGLSYFLFKLAT